VVETDPKLSPTNAVKAVEFAQRAVKLAPENYSNYAILAGAQARAGRFDDAIRTEQQAIAMAEQAHATNIVIRCRQHLALFQRNQMAHD
jgi:Flp pilus assembly protein TadD